MKLPALAAAVAGLCAAPVQAQAQELAGEGFSVEIYESGHPESNVLGVETTHVPGHLVPVADAVFHRSDNPLVRRSGGEEVPFADDRWTMSAGFGLGIGDRLLLDARLSTVLAQNGFAFDGSTTASFNTGDTRLRGKYRLLDGSNGGPGVALQLAAYLPTGEDSGYVSDGVVRFEPRIGVDYEVLGVTLAANVGYQIRGRRNVGNSYLHDDAVRWGLAARRPIVAGFGIDASIYGSHDVFAIEEPLFDTPASVRHPMEALGGVSWERAGFRASLGAGTGLTLGIGASALRVVASVGYTPRSDDEPGRYLGSRDPDGDGIPSDVDGCPLKPETYDGFADHDGCPDIDDDEDSVADIDDACPDEAGVPEKFGCRRIDSDGDGIDDGRDACPAVPGTAEEFGCSAVAVLPEEEEEPSEAPDETDQQGTDVSAVVVEAIPLAIYFNTSEAVFKPEEHPLIARLVARMEAESDIVRIIVEGHTDDRGDDEMNVELGRERAETVRQVFIDRGVDPDRVVVRSFGEARPLDDNETSEGRARNRRVAFHFVRTAARDERRTASADGTPTPERGLTLESFDTEPGARLGRKRYREGAMLEAPEGWACTTSKAPPTQSFRLFAPRAPVITGVLYPGWKADVDIRCSSISGEVQLPVVVEIPSFAVSGASSDGERLRVASNVTSALTLNWQPNRMPIDVDAGSFDTLVVPHTSQTSKLRLRPTGNSGEEWLRLGTGNRTLLRVPLETTEFAAPQRFEPAERRWIEVGVGTSVLAGGASLVDPASQGTALASARFTARFLGSDWFSVGAMADIGPTLGGDRVVFTPGIGSEVVLHVPLGALRPFVSAGVQAWLPAVESARPALDTSLGADWEPISGAGVRFGMRNLTIANDGIAVFLPGGFFGAYTSF